MGWLDVVNVALNVAQVTELSRSRAQMEQMAQGAAYTAARGQILDGLRNYVFQVTQDSKALEAQLAIAPQQVFMVARILLQRFQDIGIRPDIFPEFTDKEYVQQAVTRLQGIAQQTSNSLSPDQVSRAEAGMNFILQMPLLDAAIASKSAFEQIQGTEAEWRQLDAQAGRNKGRKTIGLLLMLGGVGFGFLVCGISSIFASGSGSGVATLMMLASLGIMGGSAAGGVWLINQASKTDPRHAALQTQRAAWKSQYVPGETWNEIVAQFGDRPSAEYQSLKSTRVNFLQQMLGQAAGFEKF
jgi:hypothetical protein